MNTLKRIFCLALLVSIFASCTEDEVAAVPLGDYENGVLIMNQGGFNNGNASVSFLSNDLNTFQNNIFSLVNPGVILGDTAQDMGFSGNLAYIVLNGSNRIAIVNRYTLKSVATISTGLTNPRNIVFANGKAYVTCWGSGSNVNDDYVAVINGATNVIETTIPVVEGPEKLIVYNNSIYVAHEGGFGFGNRISVINTTSNSVSSTITVGDVPDSLQIIGTNLYVLCSGKPSFSRAETGGQLQTINMTNNTVTSTVSFATTEHPANLDIYNNEIYYTLREKIFKTTLTATTAPSTPIFATTAQGAYGIYSFEVAKDRIYLGDAGNFSAAGKVNVHSLSGTLLNSQTVGVIPAGFYFN